MNRHFCVYAFVAVLLVGGCATTTQKSPIDDASANQGLVRVDIKGMDAVYKVPEANLAQYDKLILRPIEVEFSKNWKPENDSVLYQMNKPDREKIKKDLQDAFADVFKQVLQEKGGYQIVTEPAKDVLDVHAAIVNLYINAPDVSMQTAARVRTYTTSSGEMTLIAELHDSVTGQLLSRAYDRREDMEGGQWTWTDSVTNNADARREIRRWAELLKKALDASRGKTT
ncbi:DUF3313 family protein [Povalibacter sp.]|uniref:DUF3313 family protein n=1 Tax=Povalibacter sp. TaxID=1962978 RepID=UPI002F3F5922